MDAEGLSGPPSVTIEEHGDTERVGDARHVEALLRAVQELSLARTLPDIQRIVAGSARELCDCDGSTFVLREGEQCYYADEDAIAPLWKGTRFPIDACIGGWAMLNRQAVVIPDVYLDDRIPHAAYRPTFIKSLVMVPIRKVEPVGAIGNYWANERQPSEREVSLLQSLADATSVAMENILVRERTAALQTANDQIQQLLVTDDLTGVCNRRGFYQQAAAALDVARREGRSCLLAFIDVDGLKQVNDDHGHLVGDVLITDVANVLRAAVHGSGVIARMGGDEFCILVTDLGLDPATFTAQIAAAITTFNDTENRSYRLSTSVGVTQVSADDTRSVGQLLALADGQMYEAKRTRLFP